MAEASVGLETAADAYDYSLLVDPGLAAERHPAARAWLGFGRPAAQPRSVESLKRRANPGPYKSFVYRLVGAGSGQTDIVAKLALSRDADIENAIYQLVLPEFGIPTVSSFGTLPSDYPGMTWLFIEDAGHRPYDRSNPEHQHKAALWLSQMHAASSKISSPYADSFEPPSYRELLTEASERITAVLGERDFLQTDREVLGSCVSQVDRLAQEWSAVDEFCADLPKTLVHGDFKARNLMIWESRSGAPIAAIDWSQAHWGPFAVDLHSLDVETYRQAAMESGFQFGVKHLEQVHRISVLLRSIVAIHWEIPRLERGGRDRAVRRLSSYESQLRRALPL